MFCASPSRSPACPPRCSSPGVPSRAELRGNCPSDRVSTLFFELCVVPYVELKLLGCVVPLHAHTSSVRSTDEETEGVSNVLLRKLFNGVTAITSPRLPRVCSLPPMFCLAVTFSFSRHRRIPLRAVWYALLVMMRYWPNDSECYCPDCVFAPKFATDSGLAVGRFVGASNIKFETTAASPLQLRPSAPMSRT